MTKEEKAIQKALGTYHEYYVQMKGDHNTYTPNIVSAPSFEHAIATFLSAAKITFYGYSSYEDILATLQNIPLIKDHNRRNQNFAHLRVSGYDIWCHENFDND